MLWGDVSAGGKGTLRVLRKIFTQRTGSFHQFSNWFRWTSTYPLNTKHPYFGQLPQKLPPPHHNHQPPSLSPPSMVATAAAVTPIPSCPHSSPSSCSSSHPWHLMAITEGQNPRQGLPFAWAMKTLEQPNIPTLWSIF